MTLRFLELWQLHLLICLRQQQHLNFLQNYQQGNGVVTARLQATGTAVDQTIQIVNTLKALLITQMSGTSNSAATLQQLNSSKEALIGQLNTTYQGMYVFGGSKTRSDAIKLLQLVGLGDKADRYPSELSGGEQQRVAIARAFINTPEIILADEPTGYLDEETEAEIMAFFEKTSKEKKVTMIMVTHSSELALHAEKRFRMKQGVLEKLNYRHFTSS